MPELRLQSCDGAPEVSDFPVLLFDGGILLLDYSGMGGDLLLHVGEKGGGTLRIRCFFVFLRLGGRFGGA